MGVSTTVFNLKKFLERIFFRSVRYGSWISFSRGHKFSYWLCSFDIIVEPVFYLFARNISSVSKSVTWYVGYADVSLYYKRSELWPAALTVWNLLMSEESLNHFEGMHWYRTGATWGLKWSSILAIYMSPLVNYAKFQALGNIFHRGGDSAKLWQWRSIHHFGSFMLAKMRYRVPKYASRGLLNCQTYETDNI